MHRSEAPVTTLPYHMEWRHMLVLPMQVNERLPLMPARTGDNAGHDQKPPPPLTTRLATTDPRRPSQSTTCAQEAAAYLQLCRVFARAAQKGASAIASAQSAARLRRWRNHQRPAACLAIYGLSTPVACMSLLTVPIEGPESSYPSLRRPTGRSFRLADMQVH
jgi:hypothetical protein